MDEERMRRFEASYDAYGAMVYRLAMVYLGRRADAEDVTQEVFAACCGGLRRFSTRNTKSGGCSR